MGQLLVDVYRKEGMPALFSGIVPRVMWISLGGAIFFATYEEAKRLVRAGLKLPTPSDANDDTV
jgi:solute carrier family 25 S-adenosylmethionine transporter 26